jgi:hypothetical protein
MSKHLVVYTEVRPPSRFQMLFELIMKTCYSNIAMTSKLREIFGVMSIIFETLSRDSWNYYGGVIIKIPLLLARELLNLLKPTGYVIHKPV